MVKPDGFSLAYNNWFNLNTLLKAFNYLVAQETWARELLSKHKGKLIRVDLPMTSVRLQIADEGSFVLAQDTSMPDNVTLTVGPEVFNAYLVGGKDAATSHVKVAGDVDLAQAMAKLASQLRWEVEEDLSKWVGDAMAHRIVTTFKQGQTYAKSVADDVKQSVLDYLVYEKPTLILNQDFDRFKDEIRTLRDDVERMEKRVARLMEKTT